MARTFFRKEFGHIVGHLRKNVWVGQPHEGWNSRQYLFRLRHPDIFPSKLEQLSRFSPGNCLGHPATLLRPRTNSSVMVLPLVILRSYTGLSRSEPSVAR